MKMENSIITNFIIVFIIQHLLKESASRGTHFSFAKKVTPFEVRLFLSQLDQILRKLSSIREDDHFSSPKYFMPSSPNFFLSRLSLTYLDQDSRVFSRFS